MQQNEAMKAMARRIGRDIISPNGRPLHGAIFMAARDAALAAIMETQEACAKLADGVIQDARNGDIESDLRAIASVMANRFEAGEHYALAGDRHG